MFKFLVMLSLGSPMAGSVFVIDEQGVQFNEPRHQAAISQQEGNGQQCLLDRLGAKLEGTQARNDQVRFAAPARANEVCAAPIRGPAGEAASPLPHGVLLKDGITCPMPCVCARFGYWVGRYRRSHGEKSQLIRGLEIDGVLTNSSHELKPLDPRG